MSESGVHGDHLAPDPRGEIRQALRPPRFSVVIPAYQAATTIRAALDSTLCQTYPAHETIVVDDGSTDNLEAALEPFRAQITLIRTENRGVAAARNQGLAIASADFLASLDADDRFCPERLEALAGLAQARPDLDILGTDTRFVVGAEPQGTFAAVNPFVVKGQRQAIFEYCFVGCLPAVRIESLRAIGGFDEGLAVAEDWDCWLRLILSGSEAGFVDRALYEYCRRDDSLTSQLVNGFWARVALLEKAEANPALRLDDVPALRLAERHHRSRAIDAEINAVFAGEGDRRRLAKKAVSRGVSPARRIRAGLVATLPVSITRRRRRA